jgi:hypothetical protein
MGPRKTEGSRLLAAMMAEAVFSAMEVAEAILVVCR